MIFIAEGKFKIQPTFDSENLTFFDAAGISQLIPKSVETSTVVFEVKVDQRSIVCR